MTNSLVTRLSCEPRRDGTEDLIVLLHGYGSHELDLLGLGDLLPEGLVLASVRAPMPMGPGFAWFPLASDISFTPESVASAADAAEATIAEIAAEGDFRSISLLGFSQGMAMSTVLAQRARFPYAALVGLSGFWIDVEGPAGTHASGLEAVERLPMFWGRGLADGVITPDKIARTDEVWEQLPQASKKTYPGLPHSISAAEMQDASAFLTDALRAQSL